MEKPYFFYGFPVIIFKYLLILFLPLTIKHRLLKTSTLSGNHGFIIVPILFIKIKLSLSDCLSNNKDRGFTSSFFCAWAYFLHHFKFHKMNLRMTRKKNFTFFVLVLSFLMTNRTFSQWLTNGPDIYYNGGNVGVGASVLNSRLHVEGRIRAGHFGALHLDWTHQTNWNGNASKWAGHIGFNAYRNNDDPKDYFFGSNKYTGKGVFEGSNYGFRWLYRSAINNDSDGQHLLVEYMRLTNNGYLGIGTASPDSKLTVKGNIHAEEVKVDLSVPGPDYVFEEGYDLKSLEEVQSYIQEHGHLPNIPPAKEMEANGIELGEMNMKLLEKIEELTLYLIQLKKSSENQINLLEKEILNLRNK